MLLFYVILLISVILIIYILDRVLYFGLFLGSFLPEHSDVNYASDIRIINQQSIHFYETGEGNTLLIYFHTSAGTINLMWKYILDAISQLFPNIKIITYDYRGYGFSTGYPTIENTCLDAKSITEYLVRKHKAKHLILYGRSMGAAVALYTASSISESITVDNLVLETPFFGTRYVYINPLCNIMTYILPNKFDCTKYLHSERRSMIPTTILVADEDTIIKSKVVEDFFKNAINCYIEHFPGLSHTHVFADSKWKFIMSNLIFQ